MKKLLFIVLFLSFVKPVHGVAPIFERLGMQHLTGHAYDWQGTVDTGAKWIRNNPAGISSWGSIEPINNQYNWSQSSDWTIKLGLGTNLNIIGLIGGLPYPTWAASQNCPSITNQTSRGYIDLVSNNEYAEFAGNIVQRWNTFFSQATAPRINLWEITNEPDTRLKGDVFDPECWGDHADLYADLLKKTYTSIKNVDPQAKVTTGGLGICRSGMANCQSTSGGTANSLFNPEFLDNFLSSPNIGQYFDYLSFHYYESGERDSWQDYGPGIIGKTNYIKQKMHQYGITKPLILSETSMCNGQSLDGKTYTEQDQANFIHKFAARLLALPELYVASWWEIKDTINYANCGFYHFDPNYPDRVGTKKPSFYSLQSLNNYLDNIYISYPLYNLNGTLPNPEGYLLSKSKQIWWTNNNHSLPKSIVAKSIKVTNASDGSITNISDGIQGDLDNAVNGEIKLMFSDTPLYVDIIQPSLTLQATFGYANGANSSGVDFTVMTFANNQWIDVLRVNKKNIGQLTTFTANLEPYLNNGTIFFVIGTDAAGDNGSDWANWTDIRLTKGDWEYNVLDNATTGNWIDSIGTCIFGVSCPGTYGSVKFQNNVLLEDNRVYNKTLYTSPDGPNGLLHGSFTINNVGALPSPTPISTPTPSPTLVPTPTLTPSPSPHFTLNDIRSSIQSYMGTEDTSYSPIDGKINTLDISYIFRWQILTPSPTSTPAPTPFISPVPTPTECLSIGENCDSGSCCTPLCQNYSMGFCSCQYTCQ